METMFGWWRVASAAASFWKRATKLSSVASCGLSSLMATVRPSESWVALCTSPMPPVPTSFSRR